MKKLLLLAVLAAAQAQAQTSSTTSKPEGETGTKLESVKPADAVPQTGEVDVDEVITNRKLRAETGAKKKYSFSALLNYSGGSINKPGAPYRPNLTGAMGVQDSARLSGTLGGKLKLTAMQSLSADIGVGVDRPFHTDSERDIGERSTADNPGVGYQLLSKLGGVQSVTQVGLTAYTSDFLQAMGYLAGLSFGQIAIYDFGGSKFSIGANLALGANFFDKGMGQTGTVYNAQKKRYQSVLVGPQQSDLSAGIYPFAEYVINDRFNLRTISGVWVYDHMRAESNFWTWEKNKIYQSVGLGISVTRDFYLYPNIQFNPEYIRGDRTNVAVQASINL